MSERKFASTTIRDNEDKLGLTPEQVSQLLADANTTAAKTKFMTEIDGGLIYSAMMKLYDAGGTGDEMAGISGIAGENKEDPAFWAGGSYEEAYALAGYLNKIELGIVPDDDEYNSLAKIILLHSGAAKVGNLIVEESGRVVIVDPATGKVRLSFDITDIDNLEALLAGNTGSGSVYVDIATTTTSMDLPGSVTLQGTGSITIGTFRLTAEGRGKKGADGGVAILNASIHLMRNGSPVRSVGNVGITFDEDVSQFKIESYDVPAKVFSGLPAGEYSLRLYITSSGVTDRYAQFLGASMQYSWSYAGIRQQQYGLNGLMFFYSDNHFYFTEDGGIDVRGKTNMPGILLSATVHSDGGFLDSWGAKKHASNTATKNSIGRYTVYHSIGHTNYRITASPTMANRSCHIVSRGISSFVIEWRTIGSSPTLADAGFHFQITGDNYS